MKTFIPIITKAGIEVVGQSFEEILFDLIVSSPYQKRRHCRWHPLLAKIAQFKADEMRDLDYFGHVSPDGRTANELIREMGYRLPGHYSGKGNNCESLAIGGLNPQAVAESWYGSPGHRAHVYGTHEFYREQECIGVALSKSKSGRLLSVFLSAPCTTN